MWRALAAMAALATPPSPPRVDRAPANVGRHGASSTFNALPGRGFQAFSALLPREHHQIAVWIHHVGHALAPFLVNRLEDDRSTALAHSLNRLVHIVDIDAQLDAMPVGRPQRLAMKRLPGPDRPKTDLRLAELEHHERRGAAF